MMKMFEFEVQALEKIKVQAKTKEEARMELVETITEYGDLLVKDCCISDGREIEDE